MTALIRHIEGELGKITDPIYREALGVVLEKMRATEADMHSCQSCLYHKIESCSRLGRYASSTSKCVYWEEGSIGLDMLAY